ncbi:tail fiber domain-containing protein [Saprospiraceae bacterium]|nr:tail fiber domain-containing protein [Saprospiraceae bacterium]
MTTQTFTKYLLGISLVLVSTLMIAQQTEIEYNSDTSTEGPQLLIQEDGDPGDESGEDGWARIWFKNTADATNRWGFLARPQAGATDNPDSLLSPLVMAYTGVQKFGFGRDGTLRINKKYSFPNIDGSNGQVLTTDGAGNVSWAAGGSGTGSMIEDADGDTGINLTEAVNDIINFEIDNNTRLSLTDQAINGDPNSSTLRLAVDNSDVGFQEAIIIFEDSPGSTLGGIGYNESKTNTLDIFGDDKVEIRGGFNDGSQGAKMNIGKFGSAPGVVFLDSGTSAPGNLDAFVDVKGDMIADDIYVRTDGKIGIGETTPLEELHITGSTTADIRLEASGNKFLRFYEGSTQKGRIGHDGGNMQLENTEVGGDMRFTTTDITEFYSGINRNMMIQADGDIILGRDAVFVDERGTGNDRVGINNLSPNSALHVNHFNNGLSGGFRLQNNSNNNWWKFYVSSTNNTMQLRNNTSASVVGTFATNGVYTSSDKRLKKNVTEISYGLKDLMKLNVLQYNYNSDEDNAKKSLGFFAQDLNAVIPELVLYQEDADQYSVNYAGMSVVAVKAIQEQQEQILEQQEQLENVKAENTELKNQISTILARLDTLEK